MKSRLNRDGQEFNRPKPFLHKCMNDTGIWNETKSKFDVMRSLNGNGTIVFSKQSLCKRILNVTTVSGNFNSGNLDGNARMSFTDKEIMVANFQKGVIDGILRRFRCEFGSCGVFEDPNLNEPSKLGEVKF